MERVLHISQNIDSQNEKNRKRAEERIINDSVSQSFLEGIVLQGVVSQQDLMDIGWHGLQLAKLKIRFAYPSAEKMAEARKMKKEYKKLIYGGPDARSKWVSEKSKPISAKLVLRPAINDLDESPVTFAIKVSV